jgi:hypothetical protein
MFALVPLAGEPATVNLKCDPAASVNVGRPCSQPAGSNKER